MFALARPLRRMTLTGIMALSVASGAFAEPQRIERGGTISFTTPGQVFSVYIDGDLADGYAEQEDGKVVVTPPFAGMHTVELRAGDGTVLDTAVYDIEQGPWDHIQREGALQLSSTQTFVTDEDDGSDGHHDTYDVLASGRVAMEHEGWTFAASGEVIGADHVSRAPFERHRADLSALALSVGYEGRTGGFGFRLGDVDVPGTVSLVSGGIAGRGVSVEATGFDGRARISGGVVSGVPVIGWREGDRMPEADDHRAAAGVEVDVLREGPVTLSLAAGGFTTRRPVSTGFGVSGLDDAEENTVIGVSARATALDGRLRYDGEMAHARYAAPFNGTVEATSGVAQRHRIEADLLIDDPAITAWASIERADAGFLATSGGIPADIRQIGAGIDASHGGFDLSLSGTIIDDNLDRIDTVLATRTTVLEGSLDYSFGEEWMGVATPDSISLGLSRTRHKARDGARYLAATGFGPDSLPDQTETTVSVAADWSWSHGDFGAAYDATLFDNRAAGAFEEDTVEHAVYLTGSVQGGHWALDGHIGTSWGRETDPAIDGASRSVDWGIAARLAPDGLPGLSLAYEHGRSRDHVRAFGERSTDTQATLSAALDFAPLLKRAGLENVDATLSYRMSASRFDDGFLADEKRDERIVLSIGARF